MSTNTTSQQIYDALVSKDFNPNALDIMGKDVNDPSKADLFSFEFKTENKNYGTVVVLLDSESNMEVYYGDNVGRTMEADDKNTWYDFLYLLRNIAKKNLYTFTLNDMNKLKYNMKSIAAVTEGTLLEGYYGTSKTSYSNQPKETKLIIKHSRPLGEDDARFRNIKTLFVQTNEGERFKLPFTSLTGGKAMARHVAEGGNPYDAFGQHIVEMMTEMATLQRFLRASKNKGYVSEANDLVEKSERHYNRLKRKAKRLISRRGYHEELEAHDPISITDLDETVDEIRELFLNQQLDARVESALPLLAKIQQEATQQDYNNLQKGREVIQQIEKHKTTPVTVPKIKGQVTQKTADEPDITKMKIKDIPGYYIQKGIDNVKQIDYDMGAEYKRVAGQIADKISGKSTGTVSKDQVKQRYDKLKSIPYIGDKAAADFEKNIKDDPRVKKEGVHMKELEEFEQWIDSLSAELVNENPTEEEPDSPEAVQNFDKDDQLVDDKMARVPVDAPISTHTVQKGDTLYSLAKKHGTSVDKLKQINRQDTDTINVGQKLNVPEDEQLEEAKTGYCSDQCCGSDVKAEDCTCSPDCKHCNCNAVEEVIDIDTGKQALKAERDPMLDDIELERLKALIR
jgi:LysM repeat protein